MYHKELFFFSRVDCHTKQNKRRWVCQRLVSQKSEFACKTYTVGVNIKFPYRTVYRPYRTFKKCLARPYRFILLGMTQYYCYTRSEYRAELSFKLIFLLCLYRCCSSRLFLTRPFRSSLSIVSALLLPTTLPILYQYSGPFSFSVLALVASTQSPHLLHMLLTFTGNFLA